MGRNGADHSACRPSCGSSWRERRNVAAADTPDDGRLRATLIGFTAVLMWAVLALAHHAHGQRYRRFSSWRWHSRWRSLWRRSNGSRGSERCPLEHLRHPPAVWAVGIYGLFGYHAFYFTGACGRRPSGRGQPHRLFGAAAHHPVFRAAARASGCDGSICLAPPPGFAGAALLVTGGRVACRPETGVPDRLSGGRWPVR